MKLILTRHGETEENKKGILQGHKDGKLSEEGIQQAEKLAIRLKDEKIDHIYSSDLGRAFDTAKIIARYHKDVPLELSIDLRERSFGSFDGKSKKELGWTPNPEGLPREEPDDAEPREHLFKRAEIFLHKIIKDNKNETVLAVAHGGINLVLLSILLNEDLNKVYVQYSQKNTCVNIFEIEEDKKYKMHVINCTKHLDE
jgi:broad specificity phosphatase PhoE